jgi:hypothetical protein
VEHSIVVMVADVARLLLGLLIVAFHRPVAEFVLQQEQQLVTLFRSRGLNVPSAPTTATAHNIYFGLGMFVCLLSLARLWAFSHA